MKSKRVVSNNILKNLESDRIKNEFIQINCSRLCLHPNSFVRPKRSNRRSRCECAHLKKCIWLSQKGRQNICNRSRLAKYRPSRPERSEDNRECVGGRLFPYRWIHFPLLQMWRAKVSVCKSKNLENMNERVNGNSYKISHARNLDLF